MTDLSKLVKPLDIWKIYDTDVWIPRNYNSQKAYSVLPMMDGRYKSFGLALDTADEGIELDTLELAKAAVQADYTIRILSALDLDALPTRSAPVVTDAMVEAAHATLSRPWENWRSEIRAALTAALEVMEQKT
jgi:hypothetical protein